MTNRTPLAILFQSDSVLVIDKPAGLAVHAGPSGGPSLEAHLPALRMGKRHLPQPAHRLDQDTAGCLVLGRTKPALAELGGFFARGEARKTYWAVLLGVVAGEAGRIDAPLRKTSSKQDGWRMVVDASGQAARTAWRVLGRGDGLTWVEFQPRTGRTHQLRAHAAHLGHPILGDARYGGGAGAMQLLARRIELPAGRAAAPSTPAMPANATPATPRTGMPATLRIDMPATLRIDMPATLRIDVTAPVPAHMRKAIAACGG